MHNIFLKEKTRADIDILVHKILRDLGYPDPPVRTEEVIECLKLDKRYYSVTNESFLRDAAHRLWVAGQQVWKRPGLLLDAVRTLSLKALYLPDRKRILIDENLPPIKQRWAEGHESIHSMIPWHDALMLGDTRQTLSPGCHFQLESEANYGTGRLLFLQDRFLEFLEPGQLSINHLKVVATTFGNSITSTLWRAIESVDFPAVGVISGHPNHPPDGFDPINPCEHTIRSRKFAERFGNVTEFLLYGRVKAYCGWAKGGPLGGDEVLLRDAFGKVHVFEFETFYNTYQALTLGVYKCPRALMLQVG